MRLLLQKLVFYSRSAISFLNPNFAIVIARQYWEITIKCPKECLPAIEYQTKKGQNKIYYKVEKKFQYESLATNIRCSLGK